MTGSHSPQGASDHAVINRNHRQLTTHTRLTLFYTTGFEPFWACYPTRTFLVSTVTAKQKLKNPE